MRSLRRGPIVWTLFLSAGAVGLHAQESESQSTFDYLAAETRSLLLVADCSSLQAASTYLETMLLVASRDAALADRVAPVTEARVSVDAAIRTACPPSEWPGGGEVFPIDVDRLGAGDGGLLGGGGGTTGRVIAPGIVWATLFMTDAARERFLATVPETTGDLVTRWRALNPQLHELFRRRLEAEVVRPSIGDELLRLGDPNSPELGNLVDRLRLGGPGGAGPGGGGG